MPDVAEVDGRRRVICRRAPPLSSNAGRAVYRRGRGVAPVTRRGDRREAAPSASGAGETPRPARRPARDVAPSTFGTGESRGRRRGHARCRPSTPGTGRHYSRRRNHRAVPSRLPPGRGRNVTAGAAASAQYCPCYLQDGGAPRAQPRPARGAAPSTSRTGGTPLLAP